jgi:dTDP-4-dehydrorhamnose reductase
LRTSIVGPDNNENAIGLFKWFITQNGSVNGYNKVIWTGVTTIELAKAIKIAIDNNLCGLHHIVNNDFIAKKDLLELFKKYFNKSINIETDDAIECEKTLVRTENSYSFNIPTYEDMVREMKEWVLKHKDLYPLIFENCELGAEKLK